ncbi:AAEL005406-PA [Aedes aegypti]|uniref:AAEL005406-PA n=2 Tax=Aedes aegypti TaxID=7159 RepID=A0A1S4FAF8_AEDAE|nr:uncharacterized protein LOC5566463 [Aedes aegypti]EAT43107.1 AAEL005406-PA [Aedes aegypti]
MGISVQHASLDLELPSLGRNRSELRCYTCGQYSPFLIYLSYNEKAVKFCREAKHIQMFCPICSPNPDLYKRFHTGEDLFRADSILNDQRLLNLLAEYVSEEDKYACEDKIIITENTQLCSPYKAVAKRSAPKSHKLKQLMDLFPEAHRMRNEHFVDREDLCEGMKRKYHDICVSYMDISEAGGSQLIDNFDIMIDKTPMVMGPSRHSRIPAITVTGARSGPDVVLSDSDREIRAVGDSSDDEIEVASLASGRSASGSNITVLNEVEISSEEPVGNWDIQLSSQSQSQNVSRQASQITLAGQSLSQSQSVDISSQSVAGGAKQSQISYGSESSESSDSCIIDFPPSRRRPPSADDGQQPGPSNVKRRRVSPRGNRPMNPTPEEIQENPRMGGRIPRLGGG